MSENEHSPVNEKLERYLQEVGFFTHPSYICEHGRLSRKCPECELNQANSEIERLKSALEQIASVSMSMFVSQQHMISYCKTVAHNALAGDKK